MGCLVCRGAMFGWFFVAGIQCYTFIFFFAKFFTVASSLRLEMRDHLNFLNFPVEQPENDFLTLQQMTAEISIRWYDMHHIKMGDEGFLFFISVFYIRGRKIEKSLCSCFPVLHPAFICGTWQNARKIDTPQMQFHGCFFRAGLANSLLNFEEFS